MKLVILIVFLVLPCQLVFAQVNFGDLLNSFGKGLNKIMQTATSTTPSTTTTKSTTTTPTTTTIATTTPQTTTTTGGKSGGLGGLLLKSIGNAVLTAGKVAGSAIGAVAQGPLNPLNNQDPLTTLTNTTIGAVSNGMSALTQFVNATSGILNMVQGQANLMNTMIGQFQNLSNNVFANFDRLVQQMQNLSVAFSPDLSLMAPFLPFLRLFLNTTEAIVKNVLDQANEGIVSNVRNTVGTILNQTNGLQIWAAQQRSRLDGSAKKSEGEKIIDEFVNESATKIQRCVNATNNPIQQAFNYTREFVNESSDLANHIMDQIQHCLEGQVFVIFRVPQCIQNGIQAVTKAGSFVSQQVLPIQGRIAAVSVRALVDWSCIATEGVSIATSKPIAEGRIDKLLV